MAKKMDPVKKFIFILGGVRSGKSHYAVKTAMKTSKRVAFIATCTSPDAEMKERIKQHKALRPHHWKIFEAGKDIKSIFANTKL
jgi:adenosylcobinamide kinase/adenosylcobinamide-phosphate guanylyltransferase